MGKIYLAQDFTMGSNGDPIKVLKIGSTSDLDDRMKGYRVHTPGIQVLHIIEGPECDLDLESRLQARFNEYCLGLFGKSKFETGKDYNSGEWFKHVPSIIDYVKSASIKDLLSLPAVSENFKSRSEKLNYRRSSWRKMQEYCDRSSMMEGNYVDSDKKAKLTDDLLYSEFSVHDLGVSKFGLSTDEVLGLKHGIYGVSDTKRLGGKSRGISRLLRTMTAAEKVLLGNVYDKRSDFDTKMSGVIGLLTAGKNVRSIKNSRCQLLLSSILPSSLSKFVVSLGISGVKGSKVLLKSGVYGYDMNVLTEKYKEFHGEENNG